MGLVWFLLLTKTCSGLATSSINVASKFWRVIRKSFKSFVAFVFIAVPKIIVINQSMARKDSTILALHGPLHAIAYR